MASPNYSIPPWLSQPANPAAHYVTGLQIGVRIGAEQASQQFAQQQMLREQQKDEFQRQYQSQAMQMKIDEMTRKQKAITDYQNMLNQGVDPMKALMQIGPELGEDPSAIIRAQAAKEEQAQRQQFEQSQLETTKAHYASQEALEKRKLDIEEKRLGRTPGSFGEKTAAIEALDKGIEAAAQTGDPALVDEAKAKRDRQEALIYPKGTRLSGVNPLTGKRETRIVGGTTPEEDALTASTKSKLQQELQGSVQAAKVIHDIEQLVDKTTIGPFAYTAEKLGRFGLLGAAQMITGEAGAAGRAAIRGGKLDLMRELETKGHASTTVMKALQETLPSLGFFENPESAKAALEQRKLSIIAQGLNQARDLGVEPPPDLIQLLSTFPDTELMRMMNQNLIPKEDAQAAYRIQYQRRSQTPVAGWLNKTNVGATNR